MRCPQHLTPGAERDLDLAVVLLGDGAHRLEQREHRVPFDVAARRMREDRVERVVMVIVQVGRDGSLRG